QPSAAALGRGIELQLNSYTHQRSSGATGSSWVEDNLEFGIVISVSDAAIDGTLVRATGPRATDDAFGDGLAVWAAAGRASVTARGLQIEGSERAGISSFGATVSLGDTSLECNQIHLASEEIGAYPVSFYDLGGNVCGCQGQEVTCRVLSSNLAPP